LHYFSNTDGQNDSEISKNAKREAFVFITSVMSNLSKTPLYVLIRLGN